MAYDQRAIDAAFDLYARGWSLDRVATQMRKEYAGFSTSTLEGWEKRFEWRVRRAAADEKRRAFADQCRDMSRVLVAELNEVKDRLLAQIREGQADPQRVHAYNSVSKQIADLSAKYLDRQDPARLAMETLRGAFEAFVSEAARVPGLAEPLRDRASDLAAIAERVAAQHGGAQ